MKRIESQRLMIKKHLLKGNAISPMYALKTFGCFRLAAIIHVLRDKEGMNIKTEMVEYDGARFARYYLETPGQQAQTELF